jgi:STE24 endopeptidase
MTDTTRRGSKSPSVSARGSFRNEDFFEPEELTRLREYIRPLRTSKRIRVALTTAVSVIGIFVLDLGPRIASWADGAGWVLRLLLVIVVFDLIETAAAAPFSWWANLVYEKRAGHSTMTPALWLRDQLLNYVLGVGVFGALLVPVYAAQHALELWWLIGGLAMIVALLAVRFVSPVLIMPRFNKFTPMEDGPIRHRIEEIARLCGVSISGVFLMDASKRTTRANAGVTGFGKTKRVIVNDTICELPLEQLSQVIAHEVGHYRLNQPVKASPVELLPFPLALVFVEFVAGSDSVLRSAGIDDLGDPGSYPLLSFSFGLALTAWSLVSGWLSRRYEREADLEALELLGDPTSFVAVWPTIVLEDKANLEPTWWERATSTHPEVAERMQFAVDWAQLNDVPLTLPPRRSVPERQPVSV